MNIVAKLGLAAAFALSAVLGAGQVVAGASLPAPACRYDDVLTEHRELSQWKMSLLDPIFMVPRGYVPGNLVSVSSAGIAGSGSIRRFVIDDLAALADAARRNGSPLKVTSAYRSWNQQRSLYQSEDSALWAEAWPRERRASRPLGAPTRHHHRLRQCRDQQEGVGIQRLEQYPSWRMAIPQRLEIRVPAQLPGGQEGQSLLSLRAVALPLRGPRDGGRCQRERADPTGVSLAGVPLTAASCRPACRSHRRCRRGRGACRPLRQMS